MKHSVKITLILITVFLITQLLGVSLIAKYIQVTETDGEITIHHPDTAIGEASEVENKSAAYIPIIIAIPFILIYEFIAWVLRGVFQDFTGYKPR